MIGLEFIPRGPVENNTASEQDNGLALNRWQAIIWTNGGLGWWRIYASLGLNELKVH